MPIFITGDKAVLFIHIPKSGGLSIAEWLGTRKRPLFGALDTSPTFRCTPEHFTMQDFNFLFQQKVWDVAFTIVRHPFRRLESEYRWLTTVNRRLDETWPDFAAWIKMWLPMALVDRYVAENHLRPQSEFIDPSVHVFKFESGFDTIAEQVSSLCGIDNDFHSERVNASRAFETRWDHESFEMARHFYQRDFEMFDYDDRYPAS